MILMDKSGAFSLTFYNDTNKKIGLTFLFGDVANPEQKDAIQGL